MPEDTSWLWSHGPIFGLTPRAQVWVPCSGIVEAGGGNSGMRPQFDKRLLVDSEGWCDQTT